MKKKVKSFQAVILITIIIVAVFTQCVKTKASDRNDMYKLCSGNWYKKTGSMAGMMYKVSKNYIKEYCYGAYGNTGFKYAEKTKYVSKDRIVRVEKKSSNKYILYMKSGSYKYRYIYKNGELESYSKWNGTKGYSVGGSLSRDYIVEPPSIYYYHKYCQYKKGDKLYCDIEKKYKGLELPYQKSYCNYQVTNISKNKISLRKQIKWVDSYDPVFGGKAKIYKLSSKCKFYYYDVGFSNGGYKKISKDAVKKSLYTMNSWDRFFGQVYIKNGKIIAIICNGGD